MMTEQDAAWHVDTPHTTRPPTVTKYLWVHQKSSNLRTSWRQHTTIVCKTTQNVPSYTSLTGSTDRAHQDRVANPSGNSKYYPW